MDRLKKEQLRYADASAGLDGLRSQGAIWSLCAFASALLCLSSASAPTWMEPGRDADCSAPRELRAERGWTRTVACDLLPGGGRPVRGPIRWLYGRRVDLNRADIRLLDALPGIGPARAAAILDERRRRRFETVHDLTRVRGIGEGIVKRLAPHVRTDPPAGRVSASASAGKGREG